MLSWFMKEMQTRSFSKINFIKIRHFKDQLKRGEVFCGFFLLATLHFIFPCVAYKFEIGSLMLESSCLLIMIYCSKFICCVFY